MISELARRLRSAGLGVTIEELQDILWLAAHLPAASSDAGAAPRSHDRNKEEAKRPKRKPAKGGREDATRAADGPDIVAHLNRKGASSNSERATTPLYSAKLRGTVRASTLRVPGVTANEHPEDLRRALRPFARRVTSRWRSTLDEDEMASSAADTGIWCPVYRAERERWFDLSLVIESSASMALWAEKLLADVAAHRVDVVAVRADPAAGRAR